MESHATNDAPGLIRPDPNFDPGRRAGASALHLRQMAFISLLSLGVFLLAAFLWLLGLPQPLRAAGPYHYVAPNGTDSGNCSISSPCRTIQRAVANASAGDEIRVTAGLYTGTVILDKSLTLRGGFTTTNWVTPDPDQNPTTVDAQNSGRVLEVSNGVSATVSGFRLTGGSSTGHGAGVYNEGILTLVDDRIYGNVTGIGGDGGGVSNGTATIAATLVLRNSQIYSNTARNFGGGLNVISGTVLIEATGIFSNSAAGAAGGIAILGGNVTVRSSLVYSNTTEASGGGIGVSDGVVRLENNTIYDNYAANQGGGVYAWSGTTAITNSLIVSNTAVSGGGIYSSTPGLSVAFTDFFGNSSDQIADSGGPIDPTTLGSSNRITNPLFVNPQNFDLHLSPGSPAIDSGAITTTATIDCDGEGRPFGAGMDRGADERTDLTSPCYARLDYSQVYTNVQAAVDAASAGSLVQVAGRCLGIEPRGGFSQTVYISKSLTLQGGYTVTNWTQPRYGPTILNAQGLGRVIYVTNTSAITPLIENLHVTGGSADRGAGVYLGANANATLRNNVIYRNEATGRGGGIYSTGDGAASLQHNTIYSNTADLGGGAYVGEVGSSGVMALSNTIVVSNHANTAGGGIYGPVGVNYTLNYNDVYGNTPQNYSGAVTTGTHDISVPPGFVDPTGGDFHLTITSEVINAADPASSLVTDFEGDSRPQGARSDIGADESLFFAEVDLSDAPESPWIVTDTESVRGTFITFTHAITNTGYTSALTDTFDITWTNSDGWDVTLVGISSPLVLTTSVTLNFTVVVSVPSAITEPLYNRTIITATSQTNTTAFDTALDIIVAPGVELAPSYTENADPGEVITYTHILTNIGSLDVFTITVDSPLGWLQWYTPTGPITLANLETELIFVRVRVTDTAPAGLADVMHVWASSMNYPDISAVVTDTTIANPTTGPRYVAPSGQDTNNNCKVSGSPCATIGYAVNQAAWGDPILVAQGTYNESGIFINQNLRLLGGYSSDFGSRTVDPTNTIINAQNGGRGLHIQVPTGFRPLVEGFTIRNGATSGVGGAIYVQASSAPTLTQLIILDSTATRGGGIYIDTGNPVLQSVTISGTEASAQGGGININSGSPLLQNVTISGTMATRGGGIYKAGGNVIAQQLRISNAVADEQGGGVYQAGGTLTISRTHVYSSSAGVGGGFYNSSGSLTLWNNFIYSNTATTGGGGGVYNGSTLNLVNDTLYGNRAATFGGGVFDYHSSSLVISNTIIAASQAVTGGGIYRDSTGSLGIDYNNLWNNTATSSPNSNVPTGAHSISADPLFVNAAAGDLHLSPDSPSVDTADPDTFLISDIDGDLRPVNQGFDMGADEVSGCLARVVNPGNGQQLGPIYGVVQNAINAAPQDYIVQISGICRGVQSRLVNGQEISQTVFISKSLDLAGGYASDFTYTGETTTLDAQGLGRVVVITDSAFVDISHLTLTGGDATGLGGGPGGGHAGGGVYNYNSFLTLQGSVITGNQAVYGGGLYNVTGTLTLGGDEEAERTYIVNNTATYGGGAYLTGGSPTIDHVTFEQNSATQGGGLYNVGSSPTVRQTLLYSNTANVGGGVYNAGDLLSGEVITVTYNSASTGGGFYNDSSGRLSLQRSTVLSNTASTSGGGLQNTGALTMVNTIVAGNTVTNGNGGGLYNQSVNLTVRHDTFYANSASGQGGGIYDSNTSVINSTLIVSNTASSGGGIYSADVVDPDFDYNDVVGSSGGDYGGNLVSGDGIGNISADPNFISTDPASGSFLRIPGGSPAEDTADPNSPITSDIDGDPRPSNRSFDIGADEVGGCYVRINGNPPTYGNIQVAVGRSNAGDQIRVAGICQGVNTFVDGGQTVSQTVFLTKTLTIQGGYTKDNWTTPDPVANPTVLDALNLGRVVYITDTAMISIDGLHLRQGNAVNGGAIFVGNGVLTMTHNLVYSNTATSNGGALYNQAGTVHLFGDNQIYGNTATSGNGGAVHNAGGEITLDDNDLRGNQATNGGAFYHAGGSALLQNNIIRSNTATNGGAIYNDATTLTVRHNTLYANSATNGGGFYTVNGNPTLVNTIFATNTATIGHAIYGPLTSDYNDAYPAANAYGGGASADIHSLSVDPRFVDAAGGDFHLQDDSPVIDKGDPTMTLLHDFEGHLRPSDQGFDMGADEIHDCWARIARTGVIYSSIQGAVDNSIPGDEIQVTIGECRGVHPYNDGGRTISQTVHITHALTLHGGFTRDFSGGGDSGPGFYPDPNASTINPTGLGRAILVTNSAVITMERFILVNGNASGLGGGPSDGDAGGGMYYNGTLGSLSKIDFYSSTAAYGGAFFNAGNNLTMYNSWIQFNTASADGGAIYNATGAMTITFDDDGATWVYSSTAGNRGGGIFNDSGQMWLLDNNLGHGSGQFSLNRANQGGAIYNNSGQIYLARNDIFDNAAQEGGAIYNATGKVTLEGNRIYDNSATHTGDGRGGGGLHNSGTATLDLGNRFYGNTSAQDGGAILNTSVLTAWNTLIYTNTAVSEGGGIYDDGSSSVLHNTFYQNSTTARGGGIYIATGSNPTIQNNIFDSNMAPNGSAIFSAGGGTLGYNDYWPGNATSQVSGVSVGTNNLNQDPEFEDTGNGDFHLQDSSPVIDRGQDLGVSHDFEDDPRPVNTAPDMGADEYNACLAQLVRTGEIYGRIQDALADSISGDTIRVAQGVCEESITINKDITISGSWLKDFSGQVDPLIIATTIDATLANRVIYATGPNSINLSWVRLTDGNASGNGGGIWSDVNDLALSHVSILLNTAANGGGIYVESGTATLDEVTIYDNTASSNGGGMYVANGATANLIDSMISDNDATGGSGGGIYIATGGDVDDSGGSIYANTAGSNGGGVYNDNATYTVRNKWIYENEAEGGSGGGVYVTGGSSVLDLINALFDDNTAHVDGGGLYRDGNGSAALYHNTIHQNTAQTGQGGGVYNAGSSMVISASIVASNIAATGTYSGVQGTAQIAYTLRWNNGIQGFTPGSNGNKDGDPRFYFSFFGAYLSYSSPAIDAVPVSASHIDVDAYLDPRPQICDKDMGLDEYAVGVRALNWIENGPFPQRSATLTPTASFTYTFPLRNDSENWLRLSDSDTSLGPGTGYTETITVTLNSSKGWAQIVGIIGGANSTLSDTVATFDIGPGRVVSIEVKVTVPAGAYATDPDDDSTKEFTSLTYQARQCPGGSSIGGTSYAAETWVEEDRNFIIAPDNFGAALPGQTLTYTHIITNLGNITDTYTIVPKNGFYGSGQIAQPVPSQITLGPLQTSTVVISVTISSAAAGGLPIPDTTSVIAIASDGTQKSAGNNTVISFTTGTRYVSFDGDDSVVDESELTGENYKDNNCTQPLVGACHTIQHAIDQAADGDMIKIDQGVYGFVYTDVLTVTYKSQVITQTAFINKSVTLQGGYDKGTDPPGWDEDPPSHISHTTTLDPQGEGRAIYVTEGVTPTIARLTIVNGSAAGLGGGPGGEDAGGNIYNEGGNLTLNANRIQDNDSSTDIGGGLYHGGGDLLLQNNMLHGNQVISQGGAVYIYTGNATLQNNTLYNNSAQEGGAVYVDGGNFIVTSTVFVSNTATITGGAVYVSSAATALDYNLYDENTPGDYYPAPTPGTHNVFDDPQFVDPGTSPPDLHLPSNSPALDVGDPDTNLNIDYDNDFRPLGFGYDIGADERVPVRDLWFYPDHVTATQVSTVLVFTHTLENRGDITETVTLTSTSTQNWGITFVPSLPYTVTLGVGDSLTMTATITVPFDANGLTNVTTITATSGLTPVLVATVQDTVHAISAEWEISKAVTPSITVQPGGYLTYTLTMTNSGDLDTDGVYTITDELPTHTHFVTADPPPVLTDPVTWVSSQVVGIGEAITRTFVVTVSRPFTHGTPIVNQTYSVVGGEAYTQAVGLPVTVTVDAPASLSITKTVSADPVQPGDYLTYTITITNADSALGPALNALISDTLPTNVVYQSMGFVTPTTGIFTDTGDPLLLWQLANPIPVGGSAQVTATVRVTSPLASGTILTNTYGVTATNSTYVPGTIATPVTSTNSITLSKAVEPARVTPGGMVTYTITLTNTGNGVATVALTDVLDSAFSPPTYITNVTVPGRTWDTTEGVAAVSFTATAPASVGIYYNQWITATCDLTQTVISHVAPVTVRTCWVRLNNEPIIYDTVQAGVDASTQPTDVVKVAGYCAGVETRDGVIQTVYISKTLTVRGGYTTTNWTVSDPLANPTTLDALGGGRVVYITGDISPTIEGLRITGGDAGLDSGGGVYIISATATISNNQVFSNTANDGGGLDLNNSDATLSGNTISGNTADLDGGGLDLWYSDATLSGNTISGNTANESGGGLDLVYSDATLSGNTISGNTADCGGGLYLYGSDGTSTNNIITDNQANTEGSGLCIQGSSPRLLHTTIARNSGGDGSGVYVDYSTVVLTNTILVSHTVGITVTGGSTVTVNSILWHDTPITVSQATTATVTVQNQYQGDPAFAADGYHLTASSAAIERGVDAGVTVDIDGQSRPAGTYPDLGADEFPVALGVTKEANPDPVHAGTQLTYTIRVTNTGIVDLHATITDTLPAHVTPTGVLTWTPTITAPGGVWMQQVVVTVELGYAGPLTNVVRVTSTEGATGVYTETSEVLGIPTLIAPPNGTITRTAAITFEWSNTSATTYTLDLSGAFYTVTTNYSPTVLSDGVYTWTVASVDALGRPGVFTDAWTVTVDLTPPSVPTPTHPLSDTVMTASTVPFTWTASSDNLSGVVSYTIMVTGPTPYSNTVPVGNITSTDIILNGDGIYTWTVQAIDAAGNPSGFSSPVTFTVDATAPDRPFLIAPPNGTLTNTQAITMEWSRVNQAITYTLHLTPTGTFDIADPGSGMTVVSPTVLAEGVYTWTVAAIDSFGRSSGITDTWVFTIDTTPPLTPTLIAPPDGALITNTTVVTFEWTSISDAASYNLQITKSATQTITYSVSTNTQPITLIFGNGVYSWTVEAIDAAGNHSGYTTTWTLNLQGPPPRPTLIAPPDGTLTNTLPITFEWTAVPGGVTYTLHLSGSVPTMISDTTYMTDVVEGVYTWTVEALNIAGVSSGITDTWVFTVDTTAPSTPTLITPISGTLLATDTVTFNWSESIDNLSGVLSYTLSVSGQLPILTSTNAYTLSGLADGVYTWTVNAIDRAGNSSGFTDTLVFTIDTTPPLTPTLLTPPDGTLTSGPAITFGWSSVGPPSSITYTLNVSSTLYDVTTTTHIVTVTHDGSYTWTVKATDRAGNSTSYTDTWTVHVDTTPPTTPTQISPAAPTVVPTNTVSFTWTTSSDNFDPPFPISYTVVVTGPTPYSNTVTVGSITSTDIILNGDGVYTWTVQAIDAAGNPSSFSSPVTFTVDAVAPDRPFLIAPPNGTLTNTQAITLVWSRVDQTVMYTLQLTPTGTFDIADPGSGTTVVSPTVLAEGVYTWTVAAIDSFSRTSGFAEPWVFTIDTTPPTSPTLLAPPDGAAITDTNVITFEWTASSDALSGPVTYTLGISDQPPQVLSGTTVTFTLGDGAYTWTVWATDRAGNSAYTDTLSFEVDATPPAAPTLLAPPDGTLTNNPDVLFDWTDVTDPNPLTYTLAITGPLGPQTHDVVGTSEYNLTLSNDGLYTWTVGTADRFGRGNYTDTWTLTLDTTPPTSPTLLVPPDGVTITETNVITFEWTASSDALSGPVTYTLSISGQPLQMLSNTTVTFTLGDGAYTWTVWATDRAGNSAYTDTIAFNVDAMPPNRPTLLSPPNQTYTNSTTITFTWSSIADAVTYTLNVNGFFYHVTAPSTSQGFIGLSEGIYNWTVRSVDAYSRTLGYTDTWQVTVDVTPPASPTLILPPNGVVISTTRRPTFDWSDVNDALSGPVTYTISISNVGTFETTTSVFTPGSDLPSGVYTWTVCAYDRAGNVSSSSEAFTLTIEFAPAGNIYLPIIFRNYTPGVPPPPPTGPDLVVTSISVVPNPPGAGQSATVYVTVRNQGNRAVAYGNNFYVDFYVDREPAPFLVGDIEWGVQGSWFGVGESRTISGSYTFTGGPHQLYAQADTDNTVVETNESNNVLGPVTLNVTGLGSGEAPAAPATAPTPVVDRPRPTPTPEP